MALQSTIRRQTGEGVAGELSHHAPLRAQPVRLASTNAALNIVGSVALHWLADGSGAAADSTAGTGVFAGVLAQPKNYASGGTLANGPLAPTMTLPNNTIAEAVQEGMMYANVTNTPAIGDVVYALNASGLLVTAAPGAAAPATSRAIGATVQRYPVGVAGLALIHIK